MGLQRVLLVGGQEPLQERQVVPKSGYRSTGRIRQIEIKEISVSGYAAYKTHSVQTENRSHLITRIIVVVQP